MKEIKLKSLSLINFKGIRKLDVDFGDRNTTTICGENGTGKTTIFDAFTWLLFGKDSQNNSDQKFNIKTLGEDGRPILKLEHSVAGVIYVDGREVKLQRSYVEKWVKPSGTIEETLQNHQTVFYVNDVKCGTKKEYDAEVSGILSEELFKMITNPLYFPSLSPQSQKSYLMDMAGTITDEEVAARNEDYQKLLEELSGSNLEKFCKELSAKKSACKKDLEIIPSQIDTANRLMPEAEDWNALECQISDKNAYISDIDSQIADKSQANVAENKRKEDLQKQIGDKRVAIATREGEIKREALSATTQAQLEVEKLKNAYVVAQNEETRANNVLEECRKDLHTLNQKLDSLRSQSINKQREERAVAAEKLEYPEGAFTCPTCKRPLEVEDVEAKQNELRANFNASKAERIRAIQAEISKIKKDGETIKEKVVLMETELSACENTLKLAEDNTKTKKQAWETAKAAVPEAPNVSELISKDQQIIDLKNEISELENQLTMNMKPADTTELQEKKRVANQELQELMKRLAKREALEKAQKEISSLEEKRISTNQKLADLEQMEYIALSFQKDKDAMLMERINGMFELVSFSFVSSQLNGGEKITCVCTVNGTPYPDVNTAGKVNAGIDIINALCRYYGVTAPIFLDNRESINNILPTESQIINLCVSQDKQLVSLIDGEKVVLTK